MRSKKKLLTAAAALTTAAALTLGGTFAWQSISQSALNESTDTINPGGRLHNDIAAVENDPNATYNFIYVENFSGDEDEDGTVTGGEDIFARIRLEEYMELVMNYGVDGMEIVKNIAGAKTLKDGVTDVSADGATKQNKFDYTYELHFFDEGVDNAADNYWTWQLGNEKNAENYGGYMPTFNKNKDSLAVDQNGSYTAAIGGIIAREENYGMSGESGFAAYGAGETRAANAIYDNDGNDADELAALSAADLNDIIENGDSSAKWSGDYANAVHLENETHTAQAIPETKGVISMKAWLELDAVEQGNYWVYDTDGWVYWSSAIKPGSATGPLLEGFALDHEMDDTWYYAINVVAQFVTADDLGRSDNTGFYDESGWYDPTGLGEEKAADFENAGGAPTKNALTLLEKIGVEIGEGDEDTLELTGNFVKEDSTLTFSGNLKQDGEAVNLGEGESLTVYVYGRMKDGTEQLVSRLDNTSISDGAFQVNCTGFLQYFEKEDEEERCYGLKFKAEYQTVQGDTLTAELYVPYESEQEPEATGLSISTYSDPIDIGYTPDVYLFTATLNGTRLDGDAVGKLSVYFFKIGHSEPESLLSEDKIQYGSYGNYTDVFYGDISQWDLELENGTRGYKVEATYRGDETLTGETTVTFCRHEVELTTEGATLETEVGHRIFVTLPDLEDPVSSGKVTMDSIEISLLNGGTAFTYEKDEENSTDTCTCYKASSNLGGSLYLDSANNTIGFDGKGQQYTITITVDGTEYTGTLGFKLPGGVLG